MRACEDEPRTSAIGVDGMIERRGRVGKAFHGVSCGDRGSAVDGTVNETITTLTKQFKEFQRTIVNQSAKRGRGRQGGEWGEGCLGTSGEGKPVLGTVTGSGVARSGAQSVPFLTTDGCPLRTRAT